MVRGLPAAQHGGSAHARMRGPAHAARRRRGPHRAAQLLPGRLLRLPHAAPQAEEAGCRPPGGSVPQGQRQPRAAAPVVRGARHHQGALLPRGAGRLRAVALQRLAEPREAGAAAAGAAGRRRGLPAGRRRHTAAHVPAPAAGALHAAAAAPAPVPATAATAAAAAPVPATTAAAAHGGGAGQGSGDGVSARGAMAAKRQAAAVGRHTHTAALGCGTQGPTATKPAAALAPPPLLYHQTLMVQGELVSLVFEYDLHDAGTARLSRAASPAVPRPRAPTCTRTRTFSSPGATAALRLARVHPLYRTVFGLVYWRASCMCEIVTWHPGIGKRLQRVGAARPVRQRLGGHEDRGVVKWM